MTNDIAQTLNTWLGDAESGEPVEFSREWIRNIINEIELLEGVNRAERLEKEQYRAEAERLRGEVNNKNQRRVA